MGQVRTIENVGQNGTKSSLTTLEITYGGKESPFGGVHTGPSPAYIEPNCFSDSNGFLVVDNKLVIVGLSPLVIPTLWAGSSAQPILVKFGTFFNSIFGQINYAIGFTSVPEVRNGADYSKITFYITAWNYNNVGTPTVIGNDVLQITQYNTQIAPVAASLTVAVVPGESSDFADSGNFGLTYGASGVPIGSEVFAYTPGTTQAQAVAGLVTLLNAVSGATLMTAAPSTDGLSLVLTAVTPGAAGNLLGIQDNSQSGTANTPPAYYLVAPQTGGSVFLNLQGGADATQAPVEAVSTPSMSVIDVGGTLYMSGFFNLPLVLKYSGPGTFAVSSSYQGVKVIRKFAGSLIGVQVLPQLLQTVKNQSMIFAWSAAEDLDEWNPEDSNGNVTGAGFAELADIGENLTGLIVSNNTAFIIRAEGISYATALGQGQNPFQFAHIGLGHNGEGSQLSSLIAEYDQTGVYVGNTNIFQIGSSIQAIGEKIKSLLIPLLQNASVITKSLVYPASLGGDTFPLVFIVIGNLIFFYNTDNKSWMLLYQTLPGGATPVIADVLFLTNPSSNQTVQFPSVIAYQIGTAQPLAFALSEGVPLTSSLSTDCYVTFPQEEILFGREVTVDALYISLFAALTEDVTINFFINSTLFASLTLTPAQFPNLTVQPTEIAVFPSQAILGTNGLFTAKSPQLQVQIPTVAAAAGQVRFAKIQMYASFDPMQRPV